LFLVPHPLAVAVQNNKGKREEERRKKSEVSAPLCPQPLFLFPHPLAVAVQTTIPPAFVRMQGELLFELPDLASF
jgi:hypothetical protein